MIYLFEDRLERMKQYYGSDKLPHGILKAEFKYNVNDETDLNTYLSKNFPDAEGAIFHKSYRGNDSDVLLGKIRDYFINKRLFFVIFSGGIDSANYFSVNGTRQASVNSRTLYNNLDNFANKKDIRILCFGENFKINEYLNCIRDIQVELSGLSPSTPQSKFYINKSSMIDILVRYKGSFTELDEIVIKLIEWIEKPESMITPKLFGDQTDKAFLPALNL